MLRANAIGSQVVDKLGIKVHCISIREKVPDGYAVLFAQQMEIHKGLKYITFARHGLVVYVPGTLVNEKYEIAVAS